MRKGGAADSRGWSVRVVPNLYPAFSPESPLDVAGDPTDPLFAREPALGSCEVIIHSPDHRRWLPYLSLAQAELVMSTSWRRYRYNALPGVGSVVLLYNHGRGAGASLEHPHGQLYATQEVGPVQAVEAAGAQAFARQAGGCVFCGMMVAEEASGARVVAAGKDYVAITPWASRSGYECWIIPREHGADFGTISEARAVALGGFLRAVLWRMVEELDDPDLNWYIHSQPGASGDAAASYHWHLEIHPRVGVVAGFEMASGIYINTVAPETAAESLRARPDPGPEEQPPRPRTST